MIIRPLLLGDCAPVASLHFLHLRTNFSGRPGLRLLQLYYQAVSYQSGGCGFLAEDSGRIIGFICGVWDQEAINRILFTKYLIPLGIWGVKQVLIRPSLLLSKLKRTEHGDRDFDCKGYELRPIVVAPEARGNGAAVKLVERLIEDAAQKGYEKMHLVTEHDNVAARKFYIKAGFQEVGVVNRLGTNYVQFEKRIHIDRSSI